MKTVKLGMIFGAMILSMNTFAQEVGKSLGVDVSTRGQGEPSGVGVLLGFGNSGLLFDASFTVVPPRGQKGATYQANLSHYNGNTAFSPIGLGHTLQWDTGFVTASLSPLFNMYFDKNSGDPLMMPASVHVAFQKKSKDNQLDVEGSFDAGAVLVINPFDGSDLIMIQKTLRLQVNARLGEGTCFSPYIVFNGRNGGSGVKNQTQFGLQDQGTTTAGFALKVAI